MAGSGIENQEAELVAKLRQGDTTALQQLYRQNFDRLYSLVFHQVGRDHALTEDIVQETFLAALRSASKFRGQSKLYTWLCSIAFHKIVDFYRRQEREARYKKQPLSIGATEPEQIGASSPLDPSLLESLESEETRQVIEQALSSLPLNYRQVLVLKYYAAQMSVQEISQIMHRSPKSVEGLLSRARQALRARLTAPGEGLR